MKRRICVAMILMVALLLSACLPTFGLPQQGGILPPQEPETTAPAPQEPMPQAYAQLLEELIQAYPWNDESEYVVESHPEMSYLYRFYFDISEIGYALTDLDGNGQPELLIAAMGGGITDAFSLVDGQIVHLFDGGERYSYTVRAGGIVENQWSGSAALSGCDFSRISGGEFILQERIVYDAFHAESVGIVNDVWEADGNECWFRSNSVQSEDYQHITYEEAQNLLNTYRTQYPMVTIQYQSLSTYQNSENVK